MAPISVNPGLIVFDSLLSSQEVEATLPNLTRFGICTFNVDLFESFEPYESAYSLAAQMSFVRRICGQECEKILLVETNTIVLNDNGFDGPKLIVISFYRLLGTSFYSNNDFTATFGDPLLYCVNGIRDGFKKREEPL